MRVIDSDDLKKEYNEDFLTHSRSAKVRAIEAFMVKVGGNKYKNYQLPALRELAFSMLNEHIKNDEDLLDTLKSKCLRSPTREKLLEYLNEEMFK
jgi:hypothetical protein